MKRIFPVLLVLIFLSLACSMPISAVNKPAPTNTPSDVSVSTQAVGDLQSNLSTAVTELGANGSTTLTITEEQLTSYLAVAVLNQKDVQVSNVQVRLQNGQMEMTGKATLSVISAPASLIFSPYVEQEQLKVKVQSANFGGIDVPDNVLQQITQTINDNINSMLVVDGTSIKVSSVSIANGAMTITGKR